MGQSSSRPQPDSRRRSRLHRASSSFTTSFPHFLSRRSARPDAASTRPHSIAVPTAVRRSRNVPAASVDGSSHTLPQLQLPGGLDINFDSLSAEPDPLFSRRHNPLITSRRDHSRRSYLDRLPAALRHHRRRSPPIREDDQAAMLSRLLSVAAAATAASLMGEDHRSVSDARNLGGDGEDGTFDSFLQALQNGRIAAALRGENTAEVEPGGMPAPLNFFRMFRFGTSNGNRRLEGQHRPSSTNDRDNSTSDDEGRMVPIIIVGIRSITPGAGASHDDNIPPFLDALSTFPSTLNAPGESTIDGLTHQPAPTTRFSHRRRASMGGFPTTYDNQRHHPRPPPSTPASSALSALSSGTTTPTLNPSTATHSAAPSRRDSFVRRPAGGLETTAEEPTQQRTPRHRRLSESDFTRFGSGSSRRNGVVEPDHNPGEGSRSWIIYVLGGSYPENHPILTTPSLFTDSPTYEDMVLLSALLGPAKPPVASEDDVATAPGLFKIILDEEGRLVAISVIEQQDQANVASEELAEDDSGKDNTEAAPPSREFILITADQRCLVCLSEFEVGEDARRLVECQHFFHRECIDHWLINGRNSCPLCRRQGVAQPDTATPSTTPPPEEADSDAAVNSSILNTAPDSTLESTISTN